MRRFFDLVGVSAILVSPVISSSISASNYLSLTQHCLHDSVLLFYNSECSSTDATDLIYGIEQSKPHDIDLPSSRKNTTTSHIRQDHAPWTHAPNCTRHLPFLNSKLCVYTNSTFSNGRGISIFTTPRIAQEFASLAPFHEPIVLSKDSINGNTDTWRTRTLPGKGVGLLASRAIERGERIMAYTPVLLIHKDFVQSGSELEREKYLRAAVDQLPQKSRDMLLDLSKVFGDPRVVVQDVIEANAFEMDVGGSMHMAVFPETSRLNHDCGPNAQYYLDPTRLTHHVHATRPIKEDEEISISYTYPLVPKAQRQQSLQQGFHFTCSCHRCTHKFASDAALGIIESLQQSLNNWSASSTASPKLARKLIKLYEEEGLEGFMETPYGHAALAYNAVGDAEQAREYAELALHSAERKDGAGAQNLGMWRELSERPREHWSWRWRVRYS